MEVGGPDPTPSRERGRHSFGRRKISAAQEIAGPTLRWKWSEPARSESPRPVEYSCLISAVRVTQNGVTPHYVLITYKVLANQTLISCCIVYRSVPAIPSAHDYKLDKIGTYCLFCTSEHITGGNGRTTRHTAMRSARCCGRCIRSLWISQDFDGRGRARGGRVAPRTVFAVHQQRRTVSQGVDLYPR